MWHLFSWLRAHPSHHSATRQPAPWQQEQQRSYIPRPETIYRPLRRIISKRLSLLQYREEGAKETLRELRLLRDSMRGMSLVERERVISRLKNPGAFRKYGRRGEEVKRKGCCRGRSHARASSSFFLLDTHLQLSLWERRH